MSIRATTQVGSRMEAACMVPQHLITPRRSKQRDPKWQYGFGVASGAQVPCTLRHMLCNTCSMREV